MKRVAQFKDPTGYRVLSHMGQQYVIPAWRLRELLDSPEFALVREEEDQKLVR
jgi:hypothetical protein